MRLVDLGTLGDDEDDPIAAAIDRLRGEFGFDHVAYAGLNPLAETIHGHVTYPDAWKRHYAENELHLRDPTLLRVSRAVAPVDWGRLAADPDYPAIMRAGREFGIPETGVTLPVRGPMGDVGLLSVSSHESAALWRKQIGTAMPRLQTMAVSIHDAVMGLDPMTRIVSQPALSAREVECLQWTAAGKSGADVGTILSISARTVEVHLASARRKLNALTTPQAVGRAIAMGLIFPQ